MAITKVPEAQLQDPFLDASSISTLSLSLRSIFDAAGALSANWDLRRLMDIAGGMIVLDWGTQELKNSAGTTTANWTSQRLFDAGILVADWSVERLYDSTSVLSIDWNVRDLNGAWTLNGTAIGAPSGAAGGDLSGTYPNPTVAKVLGAPTRTLTDAALVTSIDWENRLLKRSTGSTVFDWQQEFFYDTGSVESIRVSSRQLRNAFGTIVVNWGPTGGPEIFNAGFASAQFFNWSLNDSAGNTTVEWNNHVLQGAWEIKGDFKITTLGKGLQIKTGANAKIGVATLVAGTVTVANTSVTANSRIFLTIQAPNAGTPSFVYISAITAATSFVITSGLATDTSDVAWNIIESIP